MIPQEPTDIRANNSRTAFEIGLDVATRPRMELLEPLGEAVPSCKSRAKIGLPSVRKLPSANQLCAALVSATGSAPNRGRAEL